MRTKLCWTLCLLASMILTTTSSLHAQDVSVEPTESQIENLIEVDPAVTEAKSQIKRYEDAMISLEDDPDRFGNRRDDYKRYKDKAAEWKKYLVEVELQARASAKSELDQKYERDLVAAKAKVVFDAKQALEKLEQEAPHGMTRQQERQERDLLTAMFGNLNNQNPLFSGGQTATFYGNAYPGFNPELARVNNAANKQIMDLIKKIKEAESDEVKLELKAEMKQILDEQYDEYLTHHEAPLKQLEERLKKLRDEFESRKQAKNDLVKLRLDTIWYDAIGLGWPNGQRAAGSYSGSWRQPMSPFASPRLDPPSALSPRAAVPTPGQAPAVTSPSRFNSAR